MSTDPDFGRRLYVSLPLLYSKHIRDTGYVELQFLGFNGSSQPIGLIGVSGLVHMEGVGTKKPSWRRPQKEPQLVLPELGARCTAFSEFAVVLGQELETDELLADPPGDENLYLDFTELRIQVMSQGGDQCALPVPRKVKICVQDPNFCHVGRVAVVSRLR